MRSVSLTFVVLLSAASLAGAQDAGRSPAAGPAQAKPKAPERKPIAPPRPNTMSDLFERLEAARDEVEGKGIASQIERRWMRSGSATADLLMSRAGEAVEQKDFALAIELLDRVLVLEPKWAEAWSRRASVFYLLDDPVSAIADLHQALTLEPRHFNAWAALGHIYMASDDKTRALEAYRRSLKLHPQQENLRTQVERILPEIEGMNL